MPIQAVVMLCPMALSIQNGYQITSLRYLWLHSGAERGKLATGKCIHSSALVYFAKVSSTG
jgi:hypothetical protein